MLEIGNGIVKHNANATVLFLFGREVLVDHVKRHRKYRLGPMHLLVGVLEPRRETRTLLSAPRVLLSAEKVINVAEHGLDSVGHVRDGLLLARVRDGIVGTGVSFTQEAARDWYPLGPVGRRRDEKRVLDDHCVTRVNGGLRQIETRLVLQKFCDSASRASRFRHLDGS